MRTMNVLALLAVFLALPLMGGCRSAATLVTDNVLPVMSERQRADYRDGLQQLTDDFDTDYNRDGSPKVEPEPEPEPEPPAEPPAEPDAE